ncbi:Na/Pi cotransporter family protein [Kineothrix sp. MSJ-39]|uniref:Na/Pi cotransporter family protein n=1 Tax=Kineothrix sp. MSJ-39 TaxID=2841533 RepID=UPI001C12580E|nr:Na/Pi cotransporter family protein [Kineothrix sp. MSJ-39]MBU5429434.1 Na/Pi cotransporter family protein [Kineothrix sp. MSJ-39]
MNEKVQVIFGLVGGLALFLYGMNSMSDALQKAAGEKMKKVLGFLTKNPIMGALAGALVTAVLQSSSATTVMVIGFVSAGLMSLPQAISVIFGANIGTTMTAQLMAFKISDYIYPIIFVGFMLFFACKKEKIKNIGMVIFSFGLLFEGIEIMGSVMKPLARSPIFLDLMGKVSDIPVLGVLLGMIMTLVVQSSSATIAVLQNFATQPIAADSTVSVIGLAGAIPILLGDNIGTTITALLASIGQSKNAKRTAVAHSVFNITGSILFLFLIPVLTKFVQFISPKGPEIEVISRQIANAHTTFNVVCTLIWLPLIPIMVKIVKFIIRGEDKQPVVSYQPQFLDEHLIGQSAVAMYLVSCELTKLCGHTAAMLSNMKQVLSDGKNKEQRSEYHAEYETVKKLQDRITDYISKMFAGGNLTETQAEQTAGLLVINNNVDRIADRCQEISGFIEKMEEKDKYFSEAAVKELKDCMQILEKLFGGCVEAVTDGNEQVAEKVVMDKRKMTKAQKQNNKAHLARVKKKTCSGKLTATYSSILYNMDRMADNCAAIAEEALEHITFDKFAIENEELVREGLKVPAAEGSLA